MRQITRLGLSHHVRSHNNRRYSWLAAPIVAATALIALAPSARAQDISDALAIAGGRVSDGSPRVIPAVAPSPRVTTVSMAGATVVNAGGVLSVIVPSTADDAVPTGAMPSTIVVSGWPGPTGADVGTPQAVAPGQTSDFSTMTSGANNPFKS
jgi:hypothetical protein